MSSAKRVLIVDNDELLLEAVTARLTSEGFEVGTAADAAQAMDLFRAREFDLVITDVCMPGSDGIHLAEDIRGMSQVPVLLMTGYTYAYAEAFKHLSGVRMIPKPFAWETVFEFIEELTGGGSSRVA